MSQNEILLMCPLYAPTQRRLEGSYRVHPFWNAPAPDALLERIAPTCRVVVTSGGRGIDAATLAKLPNVKLVSCFGVGHFHLYQYPVFGLHGGFPQLFCVHFTKSLKS